MARKLPGSLLPLFTIKQEPCKQKDLACAFLQRLLMTDYSARYVTTGEKREGGRGNCGMTGVRKVKTCINYKKTTQKHKRVQNKGK